MTTRHIFRFSIINGDTVNGSTTDAETARTITDYQWADNATVYFTPWLDPIYEDSDALMIFSHRIRANLVQVTAVKTYQIEED